MSADSLPREYRGKSGQTTGVFVLAGLGTLAASLPVLMEEGISIWARILVPVALVALFGWLIHASRHCVTAVDLKGIQVRGYKGRKRLPWEEIQDIRAEPHPGAGMQQGVPNIISYAYGRDGSRLQLIYVDDNHVRVEREVELMRAAWLELRGSKWEPSAEGARRISRRAARERGLKLGMMWAIFATFGMLALFLVIILGDLGEFPGWPIVVVPVMTFVLTWLGTYLRNRDV